MRLLLFALGGWFFLGVGVLGMFLPILPTTPFLLLSSACFVRSSPRLHRWLMNHPVFGRYVRDWEQRRGVRPHVKITAFTMMALVVIATTAFSDVPPWGLAVMYVLIGIGAVVVWRLPTVTDDAPVMAAAASSETRG